MELKLSKYKACICEGSAENAIIDILVDEHLLIFEREEMLDGEVIRIRDARKFESRYLRKGFDDKISIIRILDSRREQFSLSKEPKYARNKNVLVVGGSGSGKTRFFIKPNLLQMHSSYVLTDPKGTLIGEVGNAFVKAGYRIKVFNTINFKKSMRYNPFEYIHSETDILKLVTTLMANTKGEGTPGDPFWEKAEKLLYTALIGLIYYEAPEEERNFNTLVEMINSMEIREDDESFKNAVDILFEKLAEKNPDHFAVRQYAKYRLAAGKTAKSILVSCGARLAPFDIPQVRE
ncbi:VirD4-like conjugal transfer protein, CD1115 family, partial [Butyrivibrio sp. VCD2006]|uniref:VirD4-like conjugal transfer protein, CD1115 family n=1 Tax=Butyrivibrio sp. VCD2006 TaxID=1280664 RepID=UPI0018C9FEBE